MQETSQIRWLMYCKSAICKSGQFELDSVINWKPADLPPKYQWTEHLVAYPVIAFIDAANMNRLLAYGDVALVQ